MKPQNDKIEESIDKLNAWAINKGYVVEFTAYTSDRVSVFGKTISINSKCKPETQLFSLLHECGHVLLHNRERSYQEKYPESHKMEMRKRFNRRVYRTKAYQVDTITEEIDAWRKGKELAVRLKLDIDYEAYHKESSKWVFSYIDAAHDAVHSSVRKPSPKKKQKQTNE